MARATTAEIESWRSGESEALLMEEEAPSNFASSSSRSPRTRRRQPSDDDRPISSLPADSVGGGEGELADGEFDLAAETSKRQDLSGLLAAADVSSNVSEAVARSTALLELVKSCSRPSSAYPRSCLFNKSTMSDPQLSKLACDGRHGGRHQNGVRRRFDPDVSLSPYAERTIGDIGVLEAEQTTFGSFGEVSGTGKNTEEQSVVERLAFGTERSATARSVTEQTSITLCDASQQVDYRKWTRALNEQRHQLKQRLCMEKSRRVALEEMLFEYCRRRSSKILERNDERRTRSLGKHSFVTSSTSSSLSTLVDKMEKDLRISNESSLAGRNSSFDGGGASKRTAKLPFVKGEEKENFYESTSLFSAPEPRRQSGTRKAGKMSPLLRRKSVQNSIDSTTNIEPNGLDRKGKMEQSPNTSQKSVGDNGWWWVSSAGNVTRTMPQCVLKDSLVMKRPDFVVKSRERQRRIAEVNRWRTEAATLKRLLAEQVLQGQRTVDEANEIINAHMPKKEPCAFSKRDMIASTKRKYKQLPEYQAKQSELRREIFRRTNRIRREMFKQKIVSTVLKSRAL